MSWQTGIRIEPAPTNDTTSRREGLHRVLELMPDGEPAFRLSPRCQTVRAGLNGVSSTARCSWAAPKSALPTRKMIAADLDVLLAQARRYAVTAKREFVSPAEDRADI